MRGARARYGLREATTLGASLRYEWVRLGVCYWRPSTLATGAGAIVSMRSGFALLLSLCVRLSPSPPRDEGAQGGVLCRRLVCDCDAATTRYAEIVLPTRLMGYVCVDADVMLRARSRGRRALANGTRRRVSRWLRSVSRCIRGRVSQSASGLCGFSCPTASTTLSWHFSGLAYGLGCYSGWDPIGPGVMSYV